MVQHNTIDHTGVPGVGGSVATDTIWDAAGDLVVGTGANTAARLAIGGTNGMALRRVSGAVAWDLPPGHEFDYVEVTSGAVSIAATSEGTATTVVTGNSVTYDGSTVVMIEYFCYASRPDSGAAGRTMTYVLYDGSSSIGLFGLQKSPVNGQTLNEPVCLRRRLTPSAAAHTYSVRAFVDAGTGSAGNGAGGSGANMPLFIRITKV